jgi:2-dehydro-3-deoxy-D-arabinonate dehydratase
MILTRYLVNGTPRWLAEHTDGAALLAASVRLHDLLLLSPTELAELAGRAEAPGSGDLVRRTAPVDPETEVWAAGVTYERSRVARAAESTTPDVYDRLYAAERPELFFKSTGWRVSGPDDVIAVRADSTWDVPEPELAAVLRPDGQVFGWTICNDVSSRSIEGENPLYLPQAKVYLGGCAVGPAIVTADEIADPYDLGISMRVERDDALLWEGGTSTALLRRRVPELADYLFRADVFPAGVVLTTGTCLVPGDDFSLRAGDVVAITIDGLGTLSNRTVQGRPPLPATAIADAGAV